MSRVIKFRAWDDGAMIYSHNNIINHSNIQLQWFFRTIRQDAIVMQFTGLLDKNGKEIYEGDIVLPVKFKDIPNIVEYVANGFYRVKKHNDKFYYNPLGTCEVRIIGNIYETPELLTNKPQ